MTTTTAIRFRSVDRPHLTLDPMDDVWPCDTCQGMDSDGCPDCRGHRLIHGYVHGRGLPVIANSEAHWNEETL
jgi:hypothetical protein